MSNRSVKKLLSAAISGLSLFFVASQTMAAADCESLKGCERKFCEIEKQLAISVAEGNKKKSDGLRESLINAKKHCTDAGLKDDLIDEIADAKEDVAEYEADLQEAKADGEQDKVIKYQEKLEEELRELKRLEKELSDLN